MPPSISNTQAPGVSIKKDSDAPRHDKVNEVLESFNQRRKIVSGAGKTGGIQARKGSSQRRRSQQPKKEVKTKNRDSSSNESPLSEHASNDQQTNSGSLIPHQGGMTGMYGGLGSPYGGMGGYGMGGYGMGSYGMGGYGGYGAMPMGGPLNGLNNYLFGIQSLVFSLGQAVQVVGMNTQAFRQLFDSASAMLDHALATWQEMQALEERATKELSEEEQKRRRRLKALRWALVMCFSWGVYRLIKSIFLARKRGKRKLHNHEMYASMNQNPRMGALNSSHNSIHQMSPYNAFGPSMYPQSAAFGNDFGEPTFTSSGRIF